jgi:hypothetical protein
VRYELHIDEGRRRDERAGGACGRYWRAADWTEER